MQNKEAATPVSREIMTSRAPETMGKSKDTRQSVVRDSQQE